MNRNTLRNVGYLLMVALIAGFLWSTARRAMGQEHTGHPPQDMEIHERFYSTWMMPDEPQRREDGKFIPVPWQKVEQNRDNPDGRSHVCMPAATATYYPPNTIFCFSLGNGA